MERRYRLTSPTDFQRVRREGKSYAHPLVVLTACRNQLGHSRFGVTTSRSLSRATDRNRAKRRLRQALRPHLAASPAGIDFVLIARPALLEAPWEEVSSAVDGLFERIGQGPSEVDG
jgi:ribonuclease P protein component